MKRIQTFFICFFLCFFITGIYAALPSAFINYRNGQYIKTADDLNHLAKSNNAVALYYRGLALIYGYGVKRNFPQGIELITRSANKGYLPAQMLIAKYYLLERDEPQQAYSWFKKAAANNHVDAQMYIAAAHLYGHGAKWSRDLAKKFYIKAAKNGNPIAQYTLAKHFLDSKHRRNHKLAVLWLKRSAAQGHVPALYELGKQYFEGKNTDKNLEEAFALFNKAAKAGNVKAKYMLAVYYRHKTPSDMKAAVDWYEQAAKEGNTDAQLQLGLLALEDKKTHSATDVSAGIEWIKKAGESGNSAAQKKLASLYHAGVGVEQNEALAKQWAERAEKTLNNQKKRRWQKYKPEEARRLAISWLLAGKKPTTKFARYKLNGIFSDWDSDATRKDHRFNQSPGLILLSKKQIFKDTFQFTDPKSIPMSEVIDIVGKLRYQNKRLKVTVPQYDMPNVNQNPSVLRNITSQAINGYAPAQFELGQLYEHGVGVEKNLEKAMFWYKKAASQNYMKADYNIGLMYLLGKGVTQDFDKAVDQLEKAALKGGAKAQYVLAILHERGYRGEGNEATNRFIQKDPQYALAMYSLAVSNNMEDAKVNLADLHLSGVVNPPKTLAEKKRLYKVVLNLYKDSVSKGLEAANLPLAFYYAEGSADKTKQSWAFNVAEKAASNENPFAIFALGLMYDRGIGVSQNKRKAIKLYKKAANKNNPVAEFILGSYYYMGYGVSKDLDKARALLEKAANQRLPFAQYNLAILMYSQNINSNFLPFLHRASAQNYIRAKLLLADYNVLHKSDRRSLADSAKIYLQLATAGYPNAQLKLAFMYEHGLYFNKDYALARIWYQKSANQGNTKAQYLLGNMYQVGKIASPSFTMAKKWYSKAAKQDYLPAKIALGFIYEVMRHDYSNALHWYEQAALSNNPAALYNLGLIYDYGKGVKVDYDKAYDEYIKAADEGYAPAQYALAVMYLHGHGVRVSQYKARRWLEKAASQHYQYALDQLAILNGRAVNAKKTGLINRSELMPKQHVPVPSR